MTPWPFNLFPQLEMVDEYHANFFGPIVTWFGNGLLGIDSEISYAVNGSGDTLYHYLLLLFYTVIAVIGTIIWSLIDRGRKQYEKLNYIFEIILRYFLASTMIVYGLYKVIPLQFSEPKFYTLLQPYGESSPMGIFWTMMGASEGYTIFAGLMEVIGGALLLHRKTKLLGCLVAIGVLTNVVAVNFFYDIPVKLFSTQLLLIAKLLIYPSLGRLSKAVLTHGAIREKKKTTLFEKNKWKIIRPAVKWGFIFIFVFFTLQQILEYKVQTQKKLPLYGLYEISHLVVNRDTVKTKVIDSLTWQYVTIEFDKSLQIQYTDDSRKGYELELDTVNRNMKMVSYQDSTDILRLNYTRTDSTLTLRGLKQQDSIIYMAKNLTKDDFLLINRGFHWINEQPFNR